MVFFVCGNGFLRKKEYNLKFFVIIVDTNNSGVDILGTGNSNFEK